MLRPYQGPGNWEKFLMIEERTNAIPDNRNGNEDPCNYQLVSLNSVPGESGQHILLEAISKHVKDKKMAGNSHQGFTTDQPHYLLQ